MTDPGPAHSLDVPIRPIRPSGGRDVRAWLVALAAVAVVGTAAGFAVLSRPAASDVAAEPSASLPGASPRASPPPASRSARVETLPDIANVPLPGAPSPVFLRRAGANPTGTQVLIVEPDGSRRTPMITTGPVTGTSVASVFGDYALVGIVVERPEQVVLVCVVRLSDGAASAIPLSGAELSGLQLGGWLP